MQVRAHGMSATERTDFLIDANRDARVPGRARQRRVHRGAVLAALLALATGFMLARGRRDARAVQWGALAVLGFLDATYLAGPLNFGDSDSVARLLGVPLRRGGG